MPEDVGSEGIWYLDRQDRDHFLKMWKWFESKPPDQPLTDPKLHRQQPPEVYIGRAPTGGIPALDQGGTGTSLDDSPQSAVCTLYAITDDGGTGTAELGDTQITRQVFNISDTDVPAGSWFLAIRDKFGRWIAVTTGGAGSEDWRWVYVTSNTSSGGYWPARLLVKDNAGNRTLGAEVRVKLLPFGGSYFVIGDYHVTRNGTVTEGMVTYELYDGKGNNHWIYPICNDNVTTYNKLYIPHPIRHVVNVDSDGLGTGSADG